MSWRDEFSDEYDVPAWFAENLEDISWKNDAAPRFSLSRSDPGHIGEDERWISVWVEHPDEEQRESEDGQRFTVEIWVGDWSMEDRVVETNDLGTAVWAVREAAKKVGLPIPPPLTSAAAPSGQVARALAEIQAHRRGMGLRPLDPAASGWTEQDVLDEAERIRRLQNTGLLP